MRVCICDDDAAKPSMDPAMGTFKYFVLWCDKISLTYTLL